MKPKNSLYMRCASGCGVIVRSSNGRLNTLQKECVERGGFVQIGKLFYCPRCAKKQKVAAG